MKCSVSYAQGQFAILCVGLGCGVTHVKMSPVSQAAGIAVAGQSQFYSDWSAPVNLGGTVNSSVNDQGPTTSTDERSLYLVSNRPGGFGGNDLWVSHRATKDKSWGAPVNLGPMINTSGVESTPTLSKDERRLYFASSRPGGAGSLDLWVSERVDKEDDLSWQSPVNLGPMINSAAGDLGPTFFEDPQTGGLVMYFYSTRPGGPGLRDIYRSTVDDSGSFTPAILVPELSTPYGDEQPSIRQDGLEIFFASNRARTLSSTATDIWVSTRVGTSAVWPEPVNLGIAINTESVEGRPALSYDGKSLYFFSDGHGGFGSTDLFVSSRTYLDPAGERPGVLDTR